MSAITVNEIGIFKCKFHQITTCKNPEYAMMKISFELQVAGEIKDWDTIPNEKALLIESKNISKFAGMTPGKVYHLKMACKFQRENNKNGKHYPAGVNYEPLEVMGEARISNAA